MSALTSDPSALTSDLSAPWTTLRFFYTVLTQTFRDLLPHVPPPEHLLTSAAPCGGAAALLKPHHHPTSDLIGPGQRRVQLFDLRLSLHPSLSDT